jgi:dipeptidase
MACDMVAALGRATVDGHLLFGHNSARPPRRCQALQLVPGRPHAADEKVRVHHLELPQCRQTCSVLAGQGHGEWGYQHGVNEHGVAVGRSPMRTRLTPEEPGLTGDELVRLALERSRTARQALDLLTDLIRRHGQTARSGAEEAGDASAFLVVDAAEAFAVESAGRHWVCQELREARALGGVSTVRQDWDRIAPGLADLAIARGWWAGDGSKLDFAGAVCPDARTDPAAAAALRRWGRATRLLGEQNGHIDVAFIRRLLADHGTAATGDLERPGEASICRHAAGAAGNTTAASLVLHLTGDAERLLVAWCAFGPPCSSVYFPVFLEGGLPAAFSRTTADLASDSLWWRIQGWNLFLAEHREYRDAAREGLCRLQARFDQDAEEFAAEGAVLKRAGKGAELQRQATLFMQHCLERFEEVCAGITRVRLARRGAGVSARAE